MSVETFEIITFVAGAALVVGGTIGCITGLVGSALGSVAFLPIALGSAIIASAALSSILIFKSLYTLYQAGHEELLGLWNLSYISGIAIGVGLAIAVNTVSLGGLSTVGIGVIIGASVPLLVGIVGECIKFIAEKVNSYIIKPAVEGAKETFPLQKKDSNSGPCTTDNSDYNEKQPSSTLESVDPSLRVDGNTVTP